MTTNTSGIGRITPAAVAILLASALLGACASPVRQDLPQTDRDGLQLVENRRVEVAYVDPDADFSQFKRVSIAEVGVAFRKNWLRDQNRQRASISHRLTQKDADRIRAALAGEFTRIFTEELEAGGYAVVPPEGFENEAQDLLLLRPAIIDLDVTAPDKAAPGITRTYTASAASMTLYLELRDAVTGDLLGRFSDSQSAPDRGYLSIANSVTNRAEADRMLRKWARLLVASLDRVNGK